MPELIETVEDGVALLTLNRPERLNALSPDMLSALRDALPRLASDNGVGAIVITGAGRGFTAGGDVKSMPNRMDQTFEQRLESYRAMHVIPQLMRTSPKVIIGMINGPAAGAGLGLALACDLRIAGRSARFTTAFANIGYSGDFGGSCRGTIEQGSDDDLRRLVGQRSGQLRQFSVQSRVFPWKDLQRRRQVLA